MDESIRNIQLRIRQKVTSDISRIITAEHCSSISPRPADEDFDDSFANHTKFYQPFLTMMFATFTALLLASVASVAAKDGNIRKLGSRPTKPTKPVRPRLPPTLPPTRPPTQVPTLPPVVPTPPPSGSPTGAPTSLPTSPPTPYPSPAPTGAPIINPKCATTPTAGVDNSERMLLREGIISAIPSTLCSNKVGQKNVILVIVSSFPPVL